MENETTKLLKMIFLENQLFDENKLSMNLFISYDNLSAVRYDYKNVVDKIKKYKKLDIEKIEVKDLQEGYIEAKAFFSVYDNIKYTNFARIIYADEKVMDVLIYNLGNDKNINEVNKKKDYYMNIFFKESNEFKFDIDERKIIDDIVGDKTYIIGYMDNNMFKMIESEDDFLAALTYEPYDYENKFQNYLDPILDKDESIRFHNALLNDDKYELKIYQKDRSLINMSLDIKRRTYKNKQYFIIIVK